MRVHEAYSPLYSGRCCVWWPAGTLIKFVALHFLFGQSTEPISDKNGPQEALLGAVLQKFVRLACRCLSGNQTCKSLVNGRLTSLKWESD